MNIEKYRMPAEWEPHEGTWLAWPHNVSHWPGKFETIPPVYAEIISALIEGGEKVFLCVNDEKMEKEARLLLEKIVNPRANLAQIFSYQIPTDASWSRDHGPIFVYGPQGLITTDWIFNAWGEKYPPWDKDDAVPKRIAEILKLPLVSTSIILEGGSIDVNGKGTLLTTEQCLLNKNRNPKLTREQIEEYLRNYLGANNILWLKEGIQGDDTDGHIDDIARFVNPTTVVCCVEETENDANYEALKKNFETLKNMKDQNGTPLTVIPLPMPDPVFYEGERLPASYANFYIANKAILLPTFNCPQDKEAAAILLKLFPDRKIIKIDCVDLAWGLGTIHCSTQQMPTQKL